jgi:hypothetical protein
MYEGRLHEGEPANVSETSEGNSFRGTVRSAESCLQAGEREENASLISPVEARITILEQDRAGRNSGAIFISSCCSQRCSTNASPDKDFTKFFPEGRQDASRPCAIRPGRHLPPMHGNLPGPAEAFRSLPLPRRHDRSPVADAHS